MTTHFTGDPSSVIAEAKRLTAIFDYMTESPRLPSETVEEYRARYDEFERKLPGDQ